MRQQFAQYCIIPASYLVILYSENHSAFFLLPPASFMAFRTLENTLLYLHLMHYLLLKVAVVIIGGGKLQLRHNKISANTQLFYDHINLRKNKEKRSSYVEE